MPTISTLVVDVETRTSKFTTGIKVAVAGLAALAAGATYAFKQFEDADKIAAQTEAVLKSTGRAAGVTADEIADLAEAISAKTAIDDEAIQSGENLLLTFTNIKNEVGAGNDIFNQATMAITDMSVAMGTDMKSAAIQVGKALQDPILGMTALRRVGVSFTAAQTEMVNKWVEQGQLLRAQKFILAELTKEFGGSAEAQATASAAAGVALENLAETIGSVLAPAFEWLSESLTTLVKYLQANVGPAFETVSGWLQTVWDKVGPLATAIGEELWEALKQTWEALKPLWKELVKLWDALEPVRQILIPILKLLAGIQLAFLWLVAEAIPPLIEAFQWVVEQLTTLAEAFRAVVTFVREHFIEPIVAGIQRIGEWINTAAGWVKDKFLAAWNAIKGPILAVLDAVIDKIQTLIGWIQNAIEWLGQLGQGVASELGSQIGMTPGGEITLGGHPIERVIPTTTPRGIGAINPRALGAVNVTVNGWVGNDQQIAARVRDELARLERRNAFS